MIRWMKDQNHIHNTRLLTLSLKLKDISRKFSNITYSLVYMEHNIQADSLSKEGLQLAQNMIVEDEYMGGVIISARSLSIDVF